MRKSVQDWEAHPINKSPVCIRHRVAFMLPIVLQHGIFGFNEYRLGRFKYSYFHKIGEALEQRGHRVIVPRVAPTGSVATRAAQMKQQILQRLDDAEMPGQRIIIFAHSMGGLDARHMITHLGMADRVAALVTLCTPHRGSPYADCCMQNLGQRLGGLKLVNVLKIDFQALRDLTTKQCALFNDTTPDQPQVKYYSIAGSRPWNLVPPWLIPSFRVVQAAEGENDGLVSVRSAKWGRYLETWATDHFHAVNRRLIVEIRNPTGDVTSKYLKILDELQTDGALQ